MKLLLLAVSALVLASCAQIAGEASQWNGTLSYSPDKDKWEVSFSRPGNFQASDGKSVVR